MDQRTKTKLEKVREICDCMLRGVDFHVNNSEVDLIPEFIGATSPSKAKKSGMILKRGSKRLGTWTWKPPQGQHVTGELYAAKSFKPKS